MKGKWRFLRPAVWGFYIVVGLEFLFMISPFALHFYSAYGGSLRWLTASPATAWLTWFFLPHFSESTSPVLDTLKPAGFLLAELGLVLFLVGVVQIYGAKLLRRGAVTGGLYRVVRHPQYLALAVLGLGVTLIWPRLLVLVSFVSMMFLYYALARWEERRCVEKYGESYRAYQERTGMILPRLPGRGPAAAVPGPGWWRGVAIYVAVLAVALVGAFGMRIFSLGRISAWFEEDLAVLSPALLEESELREAYRVALGEAKAAAIAESESKLLVYVVPADWLLPDLPLHTEEEIRAAGGGHRTPAATDRVYKLLISRPRLHDPEVAGRRIVTRAHGQEPLGIVRVDLATGSVLGWDPTPDHVIWGDIPTPLF
jgi:protein-S-isoprenylcysteine O-methyltransferase Ste14